MKAFGNFYLDVSLSDIDAYPRSQIVTRKEAAIVKSEIMAFTPGVEHQRALKNDLLRFSSAYPTLSERRARYYVEVCAEGPHFALSDGAGPIDPAFRPADVLRVLDRHRSATSGYRTIQTWIILLLTDHFEFFRNTISGDRSFEPIDTPIAKAYFADTAGRLLELPRR